MSCGDEARVVFRNLISSFVKAEVFGSSKSSSVGKQKQVVDVENEYDSSRTFIMFKVKQSLVDTDNLNAAVSLDPEGDTESAYRELVEEREQEISQVAQKILPHLKKAGIALVEI
jgi:hypothetical protein